MTADQTFALEVAKYASRETYGIVRNKPVKVELQYLLHKQMILQVLGDSACLEELTSDEEQELTGIISLHSEFYG